MIEILQAKAIESAEVVTSQSPQDFVDWLRHYHNQPMHIAFQRPLPVPVSWELEMTEPAISSDGTPVFVEFAHDGAIAIAFEMGKLLNGYTKVRAVCLVDRWLYYFHELLGAMGPDKTGLPSEGNEVVPETKRGRPTASTTDEQRKIAEYYIANNLSYEEVGNYYGVSESTVKRYVKEHKNQVKKNRS